MSVEKKKLIDLAAKATPEANKPYPPQEAVEADGQLIVFTKPGTPG